MTWGDHHIESERNAVEAQVAARAGELERARELYLVAARAETEALSALDPSKLRTLGVTVVSAVALWYKGRDIEAAEVLAHEWLGTRRLPAFAIDQLREILEKIWTVRSLEQTGVHFTGNEVLVSVSGGVVVRGGAPLDLILQKVEQVSAMYYRTAEMELKLPLRKRGGPSVELREACRPWLFQTQPGSYQFAVRIQRPQQGTLFPDLEVNVEKVSRRFLQIVRSVAEDPEESLKRAVPDDQYRETFLKLTRNLAPTGKSFSRLSICPAASPEVEPIVLQKESREAIHSALKKGFPRKENPDEAEKVPLRGVLRALDLDKDWIEITVNIEGHLQHIRVEEAGDEVDDVLGPMVNREVIVETTRTKAGKHKLRDIQAAE